MFSYIFRENVKGGPLIVFVFFDIFYLLIKICHFKVVLASEGQFCALVLIIPPTKVDLTGTEQKISVELRANSLNHFNISHCLRLALQCPDISVVDELRISNFKIQVLLLCEKQGWLL
jgi:hypothetical protein